MLAVAISAKLFKARYRFRAIGAGQNGQTKGIIATSDGHEETVGLQNIMRYFRR